MEENDIYDILRIILKAIKNKRLIWRLDGSANLKLQGVDVTVRDLDIKTDEGGFKIFRKYLKRYVVKDFLNEEIKGQSLICVINNFEVEINSYIKNSYNDKKLNMFDKLKKITLHDLQIPILPLKYAKEFYKIIGRKEKVALIEKYEKRF